MPIECITCGFIDETIESATRCPKCKTTEIIDIPGFTPRKKHKYLQANCSDLFSENGEAQWAGEIHLEKLIGDGNPRSWMDTQCGCYFVYFYDAIDTGVTKYGRAIDFTRHRDGVRITVKIKTPDDLLKHISINNIFWALHPQRRKHYKKGDLQRYNIITEKEKGQVKALKKTKRKRKRGRKKKVRQKP